MSMQIAYQIFARHEARKTCALSFHMLEGVALRDRMVFVSTIHSTIVNGGTCGGRLAVVHRHRHVCGNVAV